MRHVRRRLLGAFQRLMDALMAALVAAALGQIGDRSGWLAAILGDRFGAGRVIVMAALALVLASGIAVAGGMLIGPKLAPNAKLLFLAFALILQGVGAFFPVKSPERLDGWRIGAWATALFGLFILAFGDGIQFIVLALAARAEVPWLAAVGATIGSLAIIAPAAILGERGWLALPLRPARAAIGAVFAVAGIVLGLSAVRLI